MKHHAKKIVKYLINREDITDSDGYYDYSEDTKLMEGIILSYLEKHFSKNKTMKQKKSFLKTYENALSELKNDKVDVELLETVYTIDEEFTIVQCVLIKKGKTFFMQLGQKTFKGWFTDTCEKAETELKRTLQVYVQHLESMVKNIDAPKTETIFDQIKKQKETDELKKYMSWEKMQQDYWDQKQDEWRQGKGGDIKIN